ncbi:hypothetical protein [Myxococcus xanthus]|uniref:Uncharacterized protein n=1 Tax=Myxococcus xanthus TaxID=34 RepID=A0A7Y4IG81_MYXXA|nr:hypothetical protein [Myxococcus xanthus]NOJ78682.1 hypothetical protein [Myxococcus xanthus]NOJ85308.1 hypothetical protein [Myxococcus xanthus]
MKSNTITIKFNEENHTPDPETITVSSGTRITFTITLPPNCKLTPTITFCDTDPDACILTINDPTHVFAFTEETNTYEREVIPQIDKTKTPASPDKFIRNYVVRLVETVPPEYPLRDRVENRSPIGEPPTSSGKIEVSGGPGSELPSLV